VRPSTPGGQARASSIVDLQRLRHLVAPAPPRDVEQQGARASTAPSSAETSSPLTDDVPMSRPASNVTAS